MLSRQQKRRVLFWSAFLPAAGLAAILMWWFSMAGRVDRLVWRLDSLDPARGAIAWLELQSLYRTEWGAFEPTLAHVHDEDLVAFIIERGPGTVVPGMTMPYHATTRRIGQGPKAHCRTVGESILAMAYNEGRWHTDIEGNDWQTWWLKNQGYYGRSMPDPERR